MALLSEDDRLSMLDIDSDAELVIVGGKQVAGIIMLGFDEVDDPRAPDVIVRESDVAHADNASTVTVRSVDYWINQWLPDNGFVRLTLQKEPV